jgi:hypothetical protein
VHDAAEHDDAALDRGSDHVGGQVEAAIGPQGGLDRVSDHGVGC